jgi:hypothetical protein
MERLRTGLIILLGVAFMACHPVKGLYRHQICKHGPNCFYYEFCPDGTFHYYYWQDVLGSDVYTGSYEVKQDTLILEPDKILYEQKSRLVQKVGPGEEINIEINLLRPSRLGETDTLKVSWLLYIDNDESFVETNESGKILLDRKGIKSIKVVDYFTQFGGPPLIQLRDSIFKIDPGINQIEINVAEVEYQPSMYDWMTKKFVIKKGKLFPLTFEPEMAYLGTKTYYRRVKKSCNNLKRE